MSVLAKVGSFLTGTGAAASTTAVTGVGFMPDFIIFFNSFRSTDNSAAVTVTRRGFGTANLVNGGGGSISNQAVFSFDTNGGATTDCGVGKKATVCCERLTSGRADGGSLHVSSMDADGFTMTIDTQFGSNTRIGYLAVQGEDIDYVQSGVITEPAATGGLTVTGVGVNPDLVIFFGHPSGTSAPVTADGSSMGFGIATKEDLGVIGNACWVGAAKHGVATSVTASYCRTGDCVAFINATVTGVNSRASITSFNSDGWIMNFPAVSGSQYKIHYLAIHGIRAKIGSINADSGTSTTKVESGTQMAPKAILFVGNAKATANSAGSGSNPDNQCVGAWDSALNYFASHILSGHNNNPGGLCANGSRNDSFYMEIDTAAAFLVQTQLVSGNLNAFSYKNNVETPATTNFLWYLELGDVQRGGIQVNL